MRNDFVNLIDAHRISAVPSHTVLAQAQVVIAQPDVRPKREFSNQPSAIDLRLCNLQGADPVDDVAGQTVAGCQYVFVAYQAASAVYRDLACGWKETFEIQNLLFNLVSLTFPILEQSQPRKFLSSGALEVKTLQKFLFVSQRPATKAKLTCPE